MQNIKILGIGSSKYRAIFDNLAKAVKELNIEVEVEKFEEVEDFIRFAIVEIPTIMINNKVVARGYAPDVEELKLMLTQKPIKGLSD